MDTDNKGKLQTPEKAETEINAEALSESKDEGTSEKPKNRKTLIIAITVLAAIILIAALFVISKKSTIDKATDEYRHVFIEYSESTLDLDEVDSAYSELKKAGALGIFADEENKQLFEKVHDDVLKEYPYYKTYLDLVETHNDVKGSPISYLATEEDRNSTFAEYHKAIESIPEDDRFFQPANNLLSEAEGLVEEAESAYQQQQEEEQAEAEAEAQREQEEQERREAEEAAKKDQILIDEPGKQMYQLTAYGSSFHMEADYEGSGNFIVELLDSNQGLEDLMANEIGSYHLSRSVSITPGCTYYLVVEYNNGSWSGTWTGSYGS